MASFLITKDKRKNNIVCLESSLEGYKFNPRNSIDKYMEVNEVTIYDHEMIDAILTAKFNKTFLKVMQMAKMLIESDEEDDSTLSSCGLCLDQIELVRQILLNRYQKYLNAEKTELFLIKLRVIENELRIKEMYIKEKVFYLQEQEELKQGRGR